MYWFAIVKFNVWRNWFSFRMMKWLRWMSRRDSISVFLSDVLVRFHCSKWFHLKNFSGIGNLFSNCTDILYSVASFSFRIHYASSPISFNNTASVPGSRFFQLSNNSLKSNYLEVCIPSKVQCFNFGSISTFPLEYNQFRIDNCLILIQTASELNPVVLFFLF